MRRIITGELRIIGFDVPSPQELARGEPVHAILSQIPEAEWIVFFQQELQTAGDTLLAAQPRLHEAQIIFWPPQHQARKLAQELFELVKRACIRYAARETAVTHAAEHLVNIKVP